MADLTVEDVAADFGETTPQTDKARSAPKGTGKVSGLLGNNRKTRGGPRKLVKADVDRLAGVYVIIGMALMPMRPNLGAAFGQSAENCANAWAEWAEQNDAVRRTILWLIEGGAMGAVFFAHLPIIAAAIPEDRLPPFLSMLNAQPESNGEAPNGYMPGVEFTER
jgi:hypothetical protein